LPVSGTYVLRFDPIGATTGAATLAVHAFTDVTGTIAADGAGVPITIAVPGQLGLVTFSGTGGQIVSMTSTSSTWTSCQFGGQYTIGIRKPDGSSLVGTYNSCGPTTFFDHLALPQTGLYTIWVDPLGAITGTTTLVLYNVVDVTGPIAVNGAAVPVSIGTPGQNARLTFNGTAGQVVTAAASSSVWTACIVTQFWLHIEAPDGSTLGSGFSCWGSTWVQRTLPVDGVYTIRLDPMDTFTGSASVTLTSP
jgi:hypothetical protein